MADPTPAGSERWKPTRAGIRNIWEYDDQLFEFADGRLVLRGPNGSGKSNALALLVPFLLDGVMAANRMDSLSGGRSMKTLLLCLNEDEGSNRFRHDQRTGYAWLEFERIGSHTTIGCGARASTQRDADAWFFVTSRRPGIDLDLTPGGVPLSRRGLVEEIGAAAVHDSAEAYRVAVDRALFGLGPLRYRNLIELLLVLRRPHLAGKLNLEHLSNVLSDGLAALDDQLVADVAASFEDLEAVQRDLRRLRDAHRTVQSFLPLYRRYLRSTGRTRALVAAEAGRALQAARRRVVAADAGVVAADADVERVRIARLDCDERHEVAQQRYRAFMASAAYLDATSLIEVEGRAADAGEAMGKAAERLESAEAGATKAGDEAENAAAQARAASTGVDLAFTAAGDAADHAGVAWSIVRSDIEIEDLQSRLRALSRVRRQDISDVRDSLATAAADVIGATAAISTAGRSSEEAERAESSRREAASRVDSERQALVDVVRVWAETSGVDGLDAIVGAVELLGEPEAPTLNDVLSDVLRPLRDSLASRAARAADHENWLAESRSGLVAERERVANDPVPAPDRLFTRPADRSARQGAPFYACVDFARDVPAADRAGLEAALEAAGILDSWVGHDSGDFDAWLDPVAPTAKSSLADLLIATPPSNSELTAEVVHNVLASIGLADAGIAVLPDGRYHLGPLSGRFNKDEAEFIGATAREQRRQRLLADLDERISAATTELSAVQRDLAEISDLQRLLDEVAASLPPTMALLAAREVLVGAIATARTARDAANRDEQLARAARVQAERSQSVLVALAGERRLPSTMEGLSASEQLLYAYDQRANDLVNRVADLVARRTRERDEAARLDQASALLTRARHEYDELARRARGLNARVNQLRSQLGPGANAPLRELAVIESELADLRDEIQRLNEAADTAADARGGARREQTIAGEALDEYIADANEAATHLDVLRRSDVWSVVVPSEPMPPALAGDLAALVVDATTDASAEPDENALQRAYRQLLDDLGRGYDPGLLYVDHVAVVEIISDTGTFSVLWLADELAKQVTHQQELLTERDREIFERHLLTRVSEALRDLLNDADELVGGINRSLADRPTASGKSVQLRWEIDSADPAVRVALGLLRRTPELLGSDEREQLRRFFATAIAQRRAEDPASGYAEILWQVLDYRTWHAFVPQVRSASGGIQRLTRTVFRSLSGGEQAVVLHLPLFAAAAAHYDRASVDAPRLVALDEAFAGIDEGMRAELMGLLVRFDLDVLLTGHELWGTYEQVPALMVYDLLRHPPLEGVSAFAVRWDGAMMSEA